METLSKNSFVGFTLLFVCLSNLLGADPDSNPLVLQVGCWSVGLVAQQHKILITRNFQSNVLHIDPRTVQQILQGKLTGHRGFGGPR